MKVERKILPPITLDKFKNFFNYSSQIQTGESVLAYFEQTISVLEKTAVNRYYWFLVDFVNWINLECGGDIENLTPLKKNEVTGKDHSVFHHITHPEDLARVFAFSKVYINILENFDSDYVKQLRMSLYFRILNVHSEYYWVMVQYPLGMNPSLLMNEEGKLHYGLVFVTDISHIRHDGNAMMVIFDPQNQKSQLFFCNEEALLKEESVTVPEITNREKQVLRMIAKGFASKEIAYRLNIAIKTVDNHRQNMLKKTNAKSSSELVSTFLRLGVI